MNRHVIVACAITFLPDEGFAKPSACPRFLNIAESEHIAFFRIAPPVFETGWRERMNVRQDLHRRQHVTVSVSTYLYEGAMPVECTGTPSYTRTPPVFTHSPESPPTRHAPNSLIFPRAARAAFSHPAHPSPKHFPRNARAVPPRKMHAALLQHAPPGFRAHSRPEYHPFAFSC